jgi:hypothetical protein
MHIKLFALFTVLCVSFAANAQNSIILPLTTSVAQTSTADITNIAPFVNPSLYAYKTQSSLSFSYDNRFLIPELSTRSLTVNYDVGYFQTGLSMSYYGYSLYNEFITGLVFARNFSEKFALGVQFNYYLAYFNASNTYHGAFFPQIGFAIQLHPDIYLAGNIFNPFQTNIKTVYSTKRLPSLFSLGFCYNFSENFTSRLQADKEISSNYRFASGFDYKILDVVTIKTGIYYSNFLVPCLGFDWKINNLSLAFNAEMHPLLGLNTGATVSLTIPKHKR